MNKPNSLRAHLLAALQAAQTVNTQAVSQQALQKASEEAVGERISRAIHAARGQAVALHLSTLTDESDTSA